MCVISIITKTSSPTTKKKKFCLNILRMKTINDMTLMVFPKVVLCGYPDYTPPVIVPFKIILFLSSGSND